MRHRGLIRQGAAIRAPSTAFTTISGKTPGNQHGCQQTNGEMVRKRRECIKGEEKEVLYDNRSVDEETRGHGLRFLDARPGQVDVEEEKEDTKANYGALNNMGR